VPDDDSQETTIYIKGPRPSPTPTTFETVVQTTTPFNNAEFASAEKTAIEPRADDDCVLRLMIDDYYE
jgi:hypothetical protein